MLVSIVIPVYGSPVLRELADRIDAVFAVRPDDDYELIFVDDGSPHPETWATLASLAVERARVRAVQLTRNFGQQAATLCGLREARGEVVITMDDDLQHLPEDLPQFLARREWDIVVGQFPHKAHGLFRRVASRAKGFFDRILIGKPKGIHLTAYRMLSRTVVDGVLAVRTPNPFIPALMFHVSRQVTGVPLRHDPRRDGRSGYTVGKLVGVFSNLVINNSSLLLRLVGHVGILLAGVSFAMALVAAYRRVVHRVAVPGWTSLIVAVCLTGGLLLFSLGVVGEYLLRIIESSEARPTYFVRRRLGGPPGSRPVDA